MIRVVIVLMLGAAVAIANHGHGGGGGGQGGYGGRGRGGGRGGGGRGSSCGSWTPEQLDCSNAPVSSSNCKQLMENLLSVLVGTPDVGNATLPPAVAAQDFRSHDAVVAEDQNVSKICCFLLSFPSAKETCCTEIAKYCNGDSVSGSITCTCNGNSNGNSQQSNGNGNGNGRGGRNGRGGNGRWGNNNGDWNSN